MSEPCSHPNGRIRYGVTDEPRETKKGTELWPALYGFCCDCGELTVQNQWLRNKVKPVERRAT